MLTLSLKYMAYALIFLIPNNFIISFSVFFRKIVQINLKNAFRSNRTPKMRKMHQISIRR